MNTTRRKSVWKAPVSIDNFYLKVTEPGKVLLQEVILRPPYDGAKDYFYITDVNDRDYLVGLIKATLPALPKPKARL